MIHRASLDGQDLADAPVGFEVPPAGHLSEHGKPVQGDAGPIADGLEALVDKAGESTEDVGIGEIDRQDTALHAIRHGVERKARVEDALEDDHPPNIADGIAVRLVLEDAGGDERVDAREIDAGSHGELVATQRSRAHGIVALAQ